MWRNVQRKQLNDIEIKVECWLLTLGTVIFIRPQQIFFSPHGIFKGSYYWFLVFSFSVISYFLWVCTCVVTFTFYIFCRVVFGVTNTLQICLLLWLLSFVDWFAVVIVVFDVSIYSHIYYIIIFGNLCNFLEFEHARTHTNTRNGALKSQQQIIYCRYLSLLLVF